MPRGPSKYDELCTELREKLQADAVVLVVAGGPLGAGVAAQVADPAFLPLLAAALRVTAAEMDRDDARAHAH